MNKTKKGYALAIGLNQVDPNHYGGWSGPLNACEFDADDMVEISKACGFEAKPIKTAKATRAAVLKEIDAVATSIKAGDIFLLTYSGHGGQLPDTNNDEIDLVDETWCLYDGQLVDDEIYAALDKFPAGARVLVFADSCHSGTSVRLAPPPLAAGVRAPAAPVSPWGLGVPRFMPIEVAVRVYRKNRSFYDKILKDPAVKNAGWTVKASVLLISGCQDKEESLDGAFNGLFTGSLLRTWNDGRFEGNYLDFHQSIVGYTLPQQRPNYFWASKADAEFETQKPFTI